MIKFMLVASSLGILSVSTCLGAGGGIWGDKPWDENNKINPAKKTENPLDAELVQQAHQDGEPKRVQQDASPSLVAELNKNEGERKTKTKKVDEEVKDDDAASTQAPSSVPSDDEKDEKDDVVEADARADNPPKDADEKPAAKVDAGAQTDNEPKVAKKNMGTQADDVIEAAVNKAKAASEETEKACRAAMDAIDAEIARLEKMKEDLGAITT